MNLSNRAYPSFAEEARKAFAFLSDLGFSEIEVQPTLVRYKKGDIEVDVYHGRQSHEIGASVTTLGSRYTISEILRYVEPKVEKTFHYPATTTPKGIATGLSTLSALMKRYGRSALDGDMNLFSALEIERKSWSEEYAIDVLTDQLRPLANEAFRQKNYAKSAELYSQIKDRLSKADLKKLSIAEKHSKE